MFLIQLFKLTSSLKRLVAPTNQIRVPCLHLTGGIRVTEENDSKGHGDQLSLSLDSQSPNEIISILEAKKDSIKGSQIVAALETLSEQNKSLHRNEQGKNIINKFIPILAQNKNKLSGQQAVDVIKLLDQLGVDKGSQIYSKMLLHTLYGVDDLSLKNLCELSNMILNKTAGHSVRSDLQSTLQKRFVMELSKGFDGEDIEVLQDALHFISQIPQLQNKHGVTQILLKKLCKCDDTIPVDNAMSIYMSLHSLDFSQLKTATLRKVQSALIKQAHLLSQEQVREIIYKMPREKKPDIRNDYYNEELADALARRVIDGRFEPGFAIMVLSRLNKSRHKSPELLQYCSTAVFRDSAQAHRKRKMTLIQTLLDELAVARDRTIYWDEIQDFVSKDAINFYKNSKDFVHLASRLISLNWFSNIIMERVFDGSFQPSNQDITSKIFCRIYQRLKLDPSYKGPLPTDSQIACLESMLQDSHYARSSRLFPLRTHLEEGIKDLACIQTDVKTRVFHELDHVVSFYEDGTPAPIIWNPSASEASDDLRYIEDMTVPPGAKLIIVQFLSQYLFYRNTNELMGNFQINVDSLELLPYPVIFVNEPIWDEVPIDDRTSFMMNAIRAKLDSFH